MRLTTAKQCASHSPLWWTFTVIVPIIYVVAGIRKKDTILLWTGLALVAGAVFTIRYYYHILPAELAMIVGGCILIAGAYALIRYLQTPRHGFTSIAPDEPEPHPLQKLPIESLILAETFKSTPTQSADPSGSFGGGYIPVEPALAAHTKPPLRQLRSGHANEMNRTFKEQVRSYDKSNIMNLDEYLKMEGREEGRKEKRTSIVLNLLTKSNLSDEQIADIVEVSVAFVEEIKKSKK